MDKNTYAYSENKELDYNYPAGTDYYYPLHKVLLPDTYTNIYSTEGEDVVQILELMFGIDEIEIDDSLF